jgi:hypothetical protein
LILTWENYRADGANRYFLLINSINLSDDSFKERIKGTIQRFVEKYGNKITIDIFDDKGVLENTYKYDKTYDIKASTSQQFLKDQERHWISGYDGDCSTGLYLNTLWFFSGICWLLY